MARLGVLPVRRFGDEHFRGEGAPLLFAGNALHADLSPDGAGSAIFGWLLTMLGQSDGFPVQRGCRRRRCAGPRGCRPAAGVIRLDAEPRVADRRRGGGRGGAIPGEVVRARRAVLADVPAPQLYTDLVGPQHLPARLLARPGQFRMGHRDAEDRLGAVGPGSLECRMRRQVGPFTSAADLNGVTDYAADLSDPVVIRGSRSCCSVR